MTMLEKAARAVGDEIGHYDTMLANKREWIDRRGVDHRGDPVDVNGPFKDDCTDIARAVLLAIREPHKADDRIASVHRGNTLSWDCDAEGVRFIRAAMIDAILAGETET